MHFHTFQLINFIKGLLGDAPTMDFNNTPMLFWPPFSWIPFFSFEFPLNYPRMPSEFPCADSEPPCFEMSQLYPVVCSFPHFKHLSCSLFHELPFSRPRTCKFWRAWLLQTTTACDIIWILFLCGRSYCERQSEPLLYKLQRKKLRTCRFWHDVGHYLNSVSVW